MDRLESRVFAFAYEVDRVPRYWALRELWGATKQDEDAKRGTLWAWEIATCGAMGDSGGYLDGEVVMYGLHVAGERAEHAVGAFAARLDAAAGLHFLEPGKPGDGVEAFEKSVPGSGREFHSAVDHLTRLAWGARCEDFLTDPCLMSWHGSGLGLTFAPTLAQTLAIARQCGLEQRSDGLRHPLKPAGDFRRVVHAREAERAREAAGRG